ncbi:MAG: hypothetical protein ACOYM3_19075 [Terrimicrobiaceae bacterium]
MHYRSSFPALALVSLASLLVAGSLSAQTRSFSAHDSFYMPPPPADYPADIGQRPEGEGSEANLNPIGLFASSPFNFTSSIREGYDDNLFTTRTDKDASFYTNWAAGVAYQFGSPRLQLNASLGGGVTYYYTRPGDKEDYNGQFALSAVYLATPKLTLSINTTTAYMAQPDTNLIGNSNRVNGDYIYSDTSIDASYQWTEKFSTVTGYHGYANYYLEQSLNDTQSFISQTFKQSFHWLLLPKTTVVLEYRANPIYYTGGADLNSFGNFALAGFDQVFNPRFKWTARLGVEQRFNQNPVDGNSMYFGPYGESNLSYQFGPASTLSWNARYGTEPSGLTNVTQRQTFRTGLAVSHGFTPRLSGNIGVNFEVDYFDQSGVINTFSQTIYDLSLGLNFQINRHVSLSAGYQFIGVYAPQNIDFEYTRNVGFVGANLSF